jgi:hypothetical protein
LHIELGLIKNSVKGMDKPGRGFECVRKKFPNVSDAKIREGIFTGPQIRVLMQDKHFNEDLNETERNAWLSFKRICKGFVGNHKPTNYQNVVQDLFTLYKAIECNMSLKIHLLESHLDFSQIISAKSVMNTEKFHQDYGKAVPRQVDLKNVGRLLLESEEVCTSCQILAKVICLNILEESFCLLHEHIKYYFAHLNFSVSLKPCLIEKFCIHI